MNNIQKRIAIAKACGVVFERKDVCPFCKGVTPYESGDDYGITLWEECDYCNNTGKIPQYFVNLPDYPHDLNAMQAAVEFLRGMEGPVWFDYGWHLKEICGSFMECIQASAEVRAEAFLKALELWEEDSATN
jgi:hypothetical protein